MQSIYLKLLVLISLHNTLLKFIHVFESMSSLSSIIVEEYILLYGVTMACSLISIWVVFNLRLLLIELWKLMCGSLYGHMFLLFIDKCLGFWLFGNMVSVYLTLGEIICFPMWGFPLSQNLSRTWYYCQVCSLF